MNIPPDETDACDARLGLLLAAARGDKPDTSRAEYGFETRLTARLAAESGVLKWWAAWTWRLAPLFAVIALGLALWPQHAPAPPSDERMMTEWSSSAEDDLGNWLLTDDLPLS